MFRKSTPKATDQNKLILRNAIVVNQYIYQIYIKQSCREISNTSRLFT